MSSDFHSSSNDRKQNNHISPFLIFIISFSVLFMAGWSIFPELIYSTYPQPIDFNHKLHVKISDAACESCHAFRVDGSFAGIPDIENCSGCHSKVENGSEDEERLIHEYVKKGRNIPWHVYARQPDSVFFSHAAHVKSAGLFCESCHGDIGVSTSLRPYEKNRLSGYSRDIWGQNMILANEVSPFAEVPGVARAMKMSDCVDCHEDYKLEGNSVQTAKEGCFVCHK